jgi:hypothetical protein
MAEEWAGAVSRRDGADCSVGRVVRSGRAYYAKAGNGRQPVGLSIMLTTYFVQQWFNLSNPGVEEAQPTPFCYVGRGT